MDAALLIAQVEHGPQLHGGLIPLVLVALALLGGLAYLVYRGRRGSRRDREPEA